MDRRHTASAEESNGDSATSFNTKAVDIKMRTELLPFFMPACVSTIGAAGPDVATAMYSANNPVNHNTPQQNTSAGILNNFLGNVCRFVDLPAPSMNNDLMVGVLGVKVQGMVRIPHSRYIYQHYQIAHRRLYSTPYHRLYSTPLAQSTAGASCHR